VSRRATWSVVAAVVTVSTVWAGVAIATREDPVDVVQDYFAAIISKDVDTALALVDRFGLGTGVPFGDDAVFLDPRAIADGWRIESAVEKHRDDEAGEAGVRVRLASRYGVASGDLLLTSKGDDDPWRLYSPLVAIEVPPSPLAFFTVNDVTVPLADGWKARRFFLFPGLYQFYPGLPPGLTGSGMEPVLAFPTTTSHDQSLSGLRYQQVAPGRLSAGGPVLAAAQRRVAELLDDCAEFSTPNPAGCPFLTDGEIDTPDGLRVRNPTDLDWTVTEYPDVSLVDDRAGPAQAGFRVVVAGTGSVELTGTGTSTDGRTVTFTVRCAIEPGLINLRARLTETGDVQLRTVAEQFTTLLHSSARNTCYRNP
jgi:hypothetical protein